jgi:hypothetical protein
MAMTPDLIQLLTAALGIVTAALNLRSALRRKDAMRAWRFIAAGVTFYVAVVMIVSLFHVVEFMPVGGTLLWPALMALLGILAGYAILDQ